MKPETTKVKLPKIKFNLPEDDDKIAKGYFVRGIYESNLKDNKDCCIYINPGMPMKDTLVTIIHEGLHYLLPDVEEREIEKYGTVLGRLVWNNRKKWLK